MGFDQPTLEALDQALEVDIETVLPDGTPRRTIIWIVVEEGEVLVRSSRGERGQWYQAAREPDAQLALIVNGEQVRVRGERAGEDESIARCSRGLERKYEHSPSLPSMLAPHVLRTTLRLHPA